MSELRQNPLSKDWVIVASERAKRPHDLAIKKDDRRQLPSYSSNCPFCPGNEQMAPPASMQIVREGQWQVRVVPNKFAALSSEGELFRRTDGLKRTVSGVGIHEVIVETPQHHLTTALLNEDDAELILQCYHERYLAISRDPRVDLITIFKNHGTAAGTSLEHPHSQLIATPIISPEIRRRMEDAMRFYDDEGQCLFCKVLAEELADAVRVVHETEHFVAFIPYASLSPFSMWIFPRRHMASFGQIHAEEISDLSRILRTVLAKLYYGLGDPDFNYVLRSAPSETRYSRYYHWYVSLIPRLTKIAGFELGSGMYINITLPEENAEFLRKVEIPKPQVIGAALHLTPRT
ncbi:MAG: galactose-1-phosphate uridylyltransferase [Acidobacteria bacterium]|nr:galactose-1-phosphate uridylyltransferase [Acidobacteriota bacterium]